MTQTHYAGRITESIHLRCDPGPERMPHPTGRFARPSLLAIHLLLTWALAWWSFVLIQPGDTFASSPVFRMFSVLMSEDQWAIALGCVSAVGLTGIISDRCRLASGISLAFTHALIAALLAAAPPFNTGTGIYSGLAVCAFFLLWQEQIRASKVARDGR